MHIPSAPVSLVSLVALLVPESHEHHHCPLKVVLFSTRTDQFECKSETAPCVIYTYFFTFESWGTIPSSFASNTWWTLHKHTAAYKVTSTIPKTGAIAIVEAKY